MSETLGAGPDTPEEAALRAEARAWLEANAPPFVREHPPVGGTGPDTERAHFERCRRWQARLFDGGWAGITWPRAYGGRGGKPVQELIFREEQARFPVTSGFLSSTIQLVGPALIEHGSEAQRLRYLRPLLRGDEAWCQLFSEPDAGSDLAALRTRAEPQGDFFVVNGQKLWTSSAQYCDFGILLARTNPDAPKHRGITFLLLDMRAPGVEVRPLVTITGSRHFNEVFLTDVRVPVENVVGVVDRGWGVARTTLAHEAVAIGSSTDGIRGVASIVALAKERGRAADPLVRQALARAYARERILGFFRDRMREAVRAGRAPDLDGSVMKVFWAETRVHNDELALDLLGPDAMLAGADAPHEGAWQERVLGRYTGTIGGGTLEVHRNGIGERVLGLPPEPRVDRDLPFRELRR